MPRKVKNVENTEQINLDQLWHATNPKDWLQACDIWTQCVEEPLEKFCQDNGWIYISSQVLDNTRALNRLSISSGAICCSMVVLEKLMPESVDALQIWCDQRDCKLIIVTNTSTDYQSRWNRIHILFYADLYGALTVENLPTSYKEQRLYNCFMRRADPVRQSWLYKLYHAGLLEQGYVSYLCINPAYADLPDHQHVFNTIHHQFDLHLDEHFNWCYQHLRKHVPIQKIDQNLPIHWHHWLSKYSLVLSTHNESSGSYWFNEKEARVLQSPSIALFTLDTPTQDFIRRIGLNIIYDRSITQNLKWTQAQIKIIDIISQDIIDLPIEQRLDLCQQNINRFRKWKTNLTSGDFSHQLLQDLYQLV